MLFSLFINEIASSVEQQGMHGIQLLLGLVEIFLLLFADDIVLISDTPRGLQNQLDVLSSARCAHFCCCCICECGILLFV